MYAACPMRIWIFCIGRLDDRIFAQTLTLAARAAQQILSHQEQLVHLSRAVKRWTNRRRQRRIDARRKLGTIQNRQKSFAAFFSKKRHFALRFLKFALMGQGPPPAGIKARRLSPRARGIVDTLASIELMATLTALNPAIGQIAPDNDRNGIQTSERISVWAEKRLLKEKNSPSAVTELGPFGLRLSAGPRRQCPRIDDSRRART
jgi:hypothetical protein